MHPAATTIAASAVAALGLGVAQSATADILVGDFEAPTYELGNIANQDGWTPNASGGHEDHVVETTSSGLYEGGQGLQGHSYIGAKAVAPGNNQIQYDLFYHTGTTATERASVGFWNDANSNGEFSEDELALSGGLVNISSPAEFGFRGSNFGTQFSSGVDAIADTWYRVFITFDDGDTAATMEVINLTAGGTQIDLNGGDPGTAFSVDVEAAAYGVLSSEAAGVAVRSSGNYTLDNIYTVGPVIPEPASLALLSLGGLALATRRRA